MVIDTIRDIWRRELDHADFTDDDDFFAIGGHSVLMAQIQVEIKQTLGIEVPMDELFRHSTVAKASAYMTSATAAG